MNQRATQQSVRDNQDLAGHSVQANEPCQNTRGFCHATLRYQETEEITTKELHHRKSSPVKMRIRRTHKGKISRTIFSVLSFQTETMEEMQPGKFQPKCLKTSNMVSNLRTAFCKEQNLVW